MAGGSQFNVRQAATNGGQLMLRFAPSGRVGCFEDDTAEFRDALDALGWPGRDVIKRSLVLERAVDAYRLLESRALVAALDRLDALDRDPFPHHLHRSPFAEDSF